MRRAGERWSRVVASSIEWSRGGCPEPGMEILACGHYGNPIREGSPSSSKRRCEPCGEGHEVTFDALVAQLLTERSLMPAVGAAVLSLEEQLGFTPPGVSDAVRAAIVVALEAAVEEVRRGWSR